MRDVDPAHLSLWLALMMPSARYVLPYEWDWSTAMLFGSILSATDPVAVVAIFNSLGVSPRLTMLVSGESRAPSMICSQSCWQTFRICPKMFLLWGGGRGGEQGGGGGAGLN